MALRFEAILLGALVIGSCLAGLTAHGSGAGSNSDSNADDAPVPMSCTGKGCGSLGFKQGGKADILVIDASSPSSLHPVPQSLVIECMIRPESSQLDVPCGQVTIAVRDPETSKRKWLKFNGSVFTIPLHKDFGRFDLHVQPKRCQIAKDVHNVLIGGITTLVFRHCDAKHFSSKNSKPTSGKK